MRETRYEATCLDCCQVVHVDDGGLAAPHLLRCSNGTPSALRCVGHELGVDAPSSYWEHADEWRVIRARRGT